MPHWGTVAVDWTWQDALNYLDTHPEDKRDHHPDKMRFFLTQCDKRPSSPQFAKNIVLEMKSFFHKNPISNIMFMGFGQDNESYPWHKDKMDVFLVQVLGDVQIRMENTEWSDTPRDFKMGDCVYIPRGTHHQIITGKSRVTFSFGVEKQPDPSTYI